ncbi:Sel1 repeat-containing protein [Rhodoblastus acidophilus]|uniref:Sel1 repeat-containing protein n=1 Tax=Rhodoblastus acidophilus TaxID=1074 RepID=A0A212QMW7_RHOAC|nr:SEL1-like repeat protein [Rhodoblastus acidophilus]PPQ38880.1 hypothetical protein CKO16_08015 [Rhodoblastus acidophilus]SNB60646.1 Sel1 repeat-containing protein [Rhodoblastus acidophilus]
MSKAAPWSIKGVDFDAREAAKEAARRDGLSLGEWLNRAIAEHAVETGADGEDFNADERLEAVAAQLARLSREAETDGGRTLPDGDGNQRLGGEGRAAADARPPAPEGWRPERWDEEPEPRRAAAVRARPARDRRQSEKTASGGRETAARHETIDAEALLEKAVAAFESRAERAERALAQVAERIGGAESERAKMLAQVESRLSQLETHLRAETRLDVEPLRGALGRLETRLDDLAKREPEPRDEETLRNLDCKLSNLLSRVERAESAPAAERDENFSRLETRFDALLARLDRSASRQDAGGRPPGSPAPGRVSDMRRAIEEISAHQRALDSRSAHAQSSALGRASARPQLAAIASVAPKPSAASQPTAALDARFEALAQKLDSIAQLNAAPADAGRIDRLQTGIESLSARIEDMRRDFSALRDAPRETVAPAIEKALRDLAARVDALAAAQPVAAMTEVAGLRGEISSLTRSLGDLAPRGAVAALENALRDLSSRVDANRSTLERVAETRGAAASPELSRQLADIARGLSDVAPRGAVAGIETAMRDLSGRVDSAREIMARASESHLEAAPEFEALRRQLAKIDASLGDVAPRGAVAALESAMRELSNRVDSAREIMARASERQLEAAPNVDALNQRLAEIGARLSDVAPRAAVDGVGTAVRDLAERIETTREIMARAAERRIDFTPDFEALKRQMAGVVAVLGDVAPREAVVGVETAVRDLAGRVDSARDLMERASARVLEQAPDVQALDRRLADIDAALGEVAPRDAVFELGSAMRDLTARVENARALMERAPLGASVDEIETLGQQVAAMSRALDDVAPRSQIAALDLAVRELGARLERSRDEGLRDAVLEPIETLAADMRRALAEIGASANIDGVVRQMRALEDKIDDLRRNGADRGDYLKAVDQSDALRGAIAEALEHMAPVERMEKQVAALTERLQDLSRQSSEASRAHETGLAQNEANWRDIGSRLDNLALRIDRAADHAPLAQEESRFDELTRRLDFMQQALAERIDIAVETRGGPQAPEGLEPLLRALAEKLESAMAPQADSRAIEALERQMARVSERLELGAAHGAMQLQQALADLAARLDQGRAQDRETVREVTRDTLREALSQLPAADPRAEQAARDIAELREKHAHSDRRAQQTLSAVHETLEKVVDRLALLEEDVHEARAGAPAQPPAEPQPRAAQAEAAPPVAAPRAPKTEAASAAPRLDGGADSLDFDPDSFLVEPGAGRPVAASTAAGRPSAASDRAYEQGAAVIKLSRDDEAALLSGSQQTSVNYIEVARRALAARAAADARDKAEGQGASPSLSLAAERAKEKFMRPLASGEKSSGVARKGLAIAGAAAVLAVGVQLFRVAMAPDAPPMEMAAPAKPVAVEAAPSAPSAAAPTPVAPASAPAAAPEPAPAQAAPVTPSPVAPPAGGKPQRGASLIDPLAVGTTLPRNADMASIQAGAQIASLKELADKGDAAAQFDLGARYADGRGFDRDAVAARLWFEKAAAQGQPQAEYRLGVIFEKGVGVPRDVRMARDYYQKAANQGHVRAMHNLAVIEAEGVEGKPDYAAAAQWFRRAAEYGVRDSQFNLAILYARGMGVAQNMAQSYVWFNAAASQGDSDAARKRDEVAARLGADELATAKKQAGAFRARAVDPAVNESPVAAGRPQAPTRT